MLQGFNFVWIKFSSFKVDLSAYQNLTTFNCTTNVKYLLKKVIECSYKLNKFYMRGSSKSKSNNLSFILIETFNFCFT